MTEKFATKYGETWTQDLGHNIFMRWPLGTKSQSLSNSAFNIFKNSWHLATNISDNFISSSFQPFSNSDCNRAVTSISKKSWTLLFHHSATTEDSQPDTVGFEHGTSGSPLSCVDHLVLNVNSYFDRYKYFWHLARNISTSFTSLSFPPFSNPDCTRVVTSVSKAEPFSQLFSANSTLDDLGHTHPTHPLCNSAMSVI